MSGQSKATSAKETMVSPRPPTMSPNGTTRAAAMGVCSVGKAKAEANSPTDAARDEKKKMKLPIVPMRKSIDLFASLSVSTALLC